MPQQKIQNFFLSKKALGPFWEMSFASITVFLVFGLEVLLLPYLKGRVFLCFYPAVFFISIFTGSFSAGLFATVQSCLIVALFLDTKILTDPIHAPIGYPNFIFFITVGSLFSYYQSKAALNSYMLVQKDRELDAIMNSVPAMIAYWDKNLKNVYANHLYSSYFSLSPEELKGADSQSILGKELYNKNVHHICQALAGIPQTFERAIAHPIWGPRHTLVNYRPDFHEGQVKGFFVIVTDVTGVKVAEIEKENLYRKLIVSEKMSSLGEMAGGIAHEINNPLAIIVANLDRMERHILNDEIPPEILIEDVSRVRRTTERIAKIVQGLRAFSRNADQDPYENVRMDQLISDTLGLCQERFKTLGIDLRLKFETHLEFQARAVQISQVLINLLNNSAYAVRDLPQKWIEIATQKNADSIRILVTDSGPGILPELTGKVMQPFFTTKEVGQGTGLGLSISKGIVEAHRGKLTLDTNCPHTRFIIELPRRSQEASTRSKDSLMSIAT